MLQVDELQLRIPGMNGEEGAILGRQVCEKVAAAIPDDMGTHHIPSIQIRLKNHSHNDTAILADHIAEQIVRQIKLATL
jgi:hypothetical protein